MSDKNNSNSTEEVKPQRISLSQLNIAKSTEETSFLKVAHDRKLSQQSAPLKHENLLSIKQIRKSVTFAQSIIQE